MNCTRRHFVLLGLSSAAIPLRVGSKELFRVARPTDSRSLPDNERAAHEHFMQLALEQAVKNSTYPFGAVIVHNVSRKVLGHGVNTGSDNPMFHGEVVAMHDYVKRHGNKGWSETTLYTTGEPCPMCMSAIIWAGIRRVVWGSSIDTLCAVGYNQILLSASEVVARSLSFYRLEALIGGVLATQTDRLFANHHHPQALV